jgi:hypothetical protein
MAPLITLTCVVGLLIGAAIVTGIFLDQIGQVRGAE